MLNPERLAEIKAQARKSDSEESEYSRWIRRQAQRSPDPEAAIALYEAMTDYSEEVWCAGWMDGFEFTLWESLREGEPDSEIMELSSHAQGWWTWKTLDDPMVGTSWCEGLQFRTLEEWEAERN